MHELMAFWAEWARPTAGSPTVAWSLLLAVAAAVGYLVQRYTGLPKVAGYSIVGAFAGFAGFTGVVWPLQGTGLFLLELGIAVVLFEAGARIPLRWFRHNPMVLVQSLFESAVTFAAVYAVLRWFEIDRSIAEPLAIVAVVASPAVLTRVVMDAHASGPVTERAIVLSTLNTLYALTLGTAMAGVMDAPRTALFEAVYPVATLLGLSFVVAALLALAMRTALRVMSPTSENTSMLLLALIAAGTAVAGLFGASAALAALMAGMLLKQLNPRPWVWPRQLGTAAAMLTMLMFVLVSTVAAQAPWSHAVAGVVLALVATRALAKIAGLTVASFGSGLRLRQALWVGCAMSPMSSVALLLASQFATASPTLGPEITSVALPAILLMEVLGGLIATMALHRAGETSKPWMPDSTNGNGTPLPRGEAA
ncbi:sodium:proton exchanger [Rhodoferax koreense]|uniref:Sodium:proton exchanger n=1 Tax=Rhodoferax koreensis TaxID=1842727 RepID=A0A1P8JRZ9_9BURK|nr:cation:proton antiporter [Rhodoferax koreense]APW36498.1 sodium:proton exchanger [Rhodoferax koreense]